MKISKIGISCKRCLKRIWVLQTLKLNIIKKINKINKKYHNEDITPPPPPPLRKVGKQYLWSLKNLYPGKKYQICLKENPRWVFVDNKSALHK